MNHQKAFDKLCLIGQEYRRQGAEVEEWLDDSLLITSFVSGAYLVDIQKEFDTSGIFFTGQLPQDMKAGLVIHH